jgi:hypothetical protein
MGTGRCPHRLDCHYLGDRGEDTFHRARSVVCQDLIAVFCLDLAVRVIPRFFVLCSAMLS